jgi:glycosyltransferase involved in cell wall biosynthesis
MPSAVRPPGTDVLHQHPASLHCLFSYDNRLGGAVHAALNVCKFLAQAGWPVEAVASHAATDDLAYLKEGYPEFPAHRLPRSFPQRYFNAATLDRWLERNLSRFDVADLHGVFVQTTLRSARVCRRLGKPYFVRSHGALDPFDLQKHARLKRWLGPILLRPLLAGAAGVICTTQLEAERLVTFGARPRRCVVPLPVPFAAPSSEAGAAFRLQHGIPKDAIVVLFMSRIDYKKGLEFLVPALAAAKRSEPQLWFVLAGTGDPAFTARVRGRIRQHGIESWTTETGFISGAMKQAAFSAANLFALPSLNENFGIVLVEAMSAGLPLLISDQVYIQKEILAAEAGRLCTTSVGSCAQTLLEMLSQPEQLQEMGRRARTVATDRFSVRAATHGLVSIYREALAGTRASHC